MEVLEAIRRRRAVRDYKPDAVGASLLQQLVAAGCWAPSAINEQPWHFTIVTERMLMDRISVLAKEMMRKETASMPRPAHFQTLLADPHFNIFYNAPVLMVISVPGDCHWGIEDAAMAAQNVMLEATALGLGSCWIGFAQSWLNSSDGLAMLELPPTQRVVAPLILGRPRVAPPPVERKKAACNWIGCETPVENVALAMNAGGEKDLAHP